MFWRCFGELIPERKFQLLKRGATSPGGLFLLASGRSVGTNPYLRAVAHGVRRLSMYSHYWQIDRNYRKSTNIVVWGSAPQEPLLEPPRWLV